MAKELPYFKFEPAEYLTKDISFCSLSSQGLFINVCSYYWQRGCILSKEQLLRRLNHPTELEELINEGIIDLIDNNISIKFLNIQLNEVEKTSKINSNNGKKGGRPSKPTLTETENKPTPLISLKPNESETKGIKEDKIKEDKIKEDKIKFNFKKNLLELVNDELLVCDYIEMRKQKRASLSETVFNSLKSECENNNFNPSEALKICIDKNWVGFKYAWVKNVELQNKENINKNGQINSKQQFKFSTASAIKTITGGN